MRHRLLGVLLGTAALSGSVTAVRQAAQPLDSARGRPAAGGQTLFAQLCQTCHGPAGQGGGDRGPALNTGTFTHGSGDADLFRAIRSGVRGTQMPPFAGLSETQIWQLVAYLRSLQSGSSVAAAPSAASGPPRAKPRGLPRAEPRGLPRAEPRGLPRAEPSGLPRAEPRGDAAAGEALFFGRAACASCHEVNARGGIVGPDLSNAGRLSPAVLEQKIVNPNGPGAASAGGRGGRGGATPATAIVKTLDGREIRGVRRNEDTFSLQMTDLAGQLRMFDKRQLSSVVIDGSSLHPRDYATRLSGGEIANLVAYLRTRQG